MKNVARSFPEILGSCPYIKLDAQGEILEALGDFMGLVRQESYGYQITDPKIAKEVKKIIQAPRGYVGPIHTIQLEVETCKLQLHAMPSEEDILILFKPILETEEVKQKTPNNTKASFILSIASNGDILDFNKDFKDQFFYTQKTLPQKRFSKYLYYKDCSLFSQILKQLTDGIIPQETIILRMNVVLDNFILKVQWVFSFDEKDQIKAIGVAQSIEIKSPKFSAQYKLLDTHKVGLWHLGKGKQPDFQVNNEFIHIANSNIDIEYQEWMKLVHPKDRIGVQDAFVRYQNGMEDIYHVTYRMNVGNSWKVVAVAGVFIKDAQGKEEAMFGVFFDLDQKVVLIQKTEQFDYLAYILDSVVVTNLDGLILYANKPVENFLGYEENKLLTTKLEDLYTGEETEELFSQLQERNDGYLIKEWQVNHKEGVEIPVEAHITLLKNEKGTPTGLIYIMKDLTEVKFYQKTIRDSADQLRRVTDTVDIVFWEFDIKRNVYSFITPHIYNLTGFRVRDWLTKPGFSNERMHPDFVDIVSKRHAEYTQKEGTYIHDYQFYRADGVLIWINEHITITINNGALNIRGSMMDVTEKIKLEEAVKKSQKEYKTLTENQKDLFITQTPGGSISYVSPNVTQLFGYTPKDFKDLNIEAYIASSHIGFYREKLEYISIKNYNCTRTKTSCTTAPKSFDLEVQFIKKDGSFFWGEVNSSRIIEDGCFLGFTTSIRDISERVSHRKQIEKLATLIDLTSNGIVLTDLDKKIQYANEGMVNLLGYSKLEFEEQKIHDIIYGKNTSKKTETEIREAFDKKEPFQKDILYYHKDGSEIWCQVNAKPIKLDGEILYVGVFTNITERVRQNKEIQKFASLIDFSDNGVIFTDMKGEIQYVNQGFEKLSGYNKKELLGLDECSIFNGKNTSQKTLLQIKKAFKEGKPYTVDIKHYHKNGTEYWSHIAGKPIQIDDETLYVSIHTDISDTIKQNQEIQKLASLIDLANYGIVVMDDNGVIEYVNNGFQQISGYSKKELIGKLPKAVLYGENTREKSKKAIKDAIKKHIPFNIDIINYHKDGHSYWANVDGSPIELDGEVKYVSFYTDITDSIKKNQEIKKFVTLMDLASYGIVISSDTGIMEYVNNAVERISGFNKEELIGKFPSDILLGQDSNEDTTKTVKYFLEKGLPFNINNIHYHKNGPSYWANIDSSPIELDGVTKYVTFYSDISDSVEKNQEIKKLATLIDLTQLGINILDKNGTIEYLNNGFLEITGYSQEDFIGKKPGSLLVGKDTNPKSLNLLRDSIKKNLPLDIDLLSYTNENQPFWMNIVGTPMTLNGELKYVTVVNDVTDKVKQTQEIQKFATLMDLATYGFIISNDKGVTEYVNKGCERITGYRKEDFIGNLPKLLSAEKVNKKVKKEINYALKNHLSFNIDHINFHKDGHAYWANIDSTPIELDDEIKYVSIYTNISDTVEKNKEIQKLATLIDLVTYGIVILDDNGIIEYANNGFQQISGYDKQELIGKKPKNVLHGKETSKKAIKAIKDAIINRTPFNIDILTYNKDGQTYWSNVDGSPIELEEETKYVCIVNDITDSIEQRNQIEKFATIIDLATYGIVVMDDAGMIEYANNGFEQISGYEKHELIGISTTTLLNGEKTSKKAKDGIINAIKNQLSFDIDIINYNKSGNAYWANVEGSPIELEGQIKYLCIVTDISDTIEQRNKIKELATLVDLSNNGIVVTDKKGITEYVNQGYEFITGYTKDELIGIKPGHLLQGKNTSKEAQIEIRTAIKALKPFDVDIINYNKKGEEYWVNINAKPINVMGEIKYVAVQSDITERIEQSREIEKLATMIGFSSNGILITDQDGATEYVNQGVLDLTGYTKEELLGKKIGHIVQGPNTSATTTKMVRDAIKEKQPFNVDIVNYHKNGQEYWVNINAKPVQFREETKFVGIQTDITHQILQSKEIQKLATLINLTNNGILITDQYGIIQYVNQGFENLTCYSREELIGIAPWVVLRGPNTSKKAGNRITDALKNLKAFNVEILQYTKFQEEYWVNIIAKPIKVGNETLYLAVYTNITESKSNQEEIKLMSNRIKLATQAADLGIWEWDLLNEKLLWYKLCMKGEEIIYDGDISGFTKMLSKVSKVILFSILDDSKKAIVHEDFTFSLTLNEKRRTIKGNFLLSYDKSGRPEKLFGMTSDITKQKEKEEENQKLIKDLKVRNKANEEFTQVISHNLRAPLANIIGLTQMLKDDTIIDQNIVINGLSDSANKIDLVIQDLNDILSISNQEIKCTEFQITDLLFEIEKQLLQDIKKHNIHLEKNITVNKLYTSRGHIYSILYNLISNAIKYSNPNETNPTVSVDVLSRGKKLLIIVKDNGMGIDVHRYKNRLFKMYQRLNSQKEGKGLGLYLIKKQSEELEGWVNLDSTLYKGSTFTINLPKQVIAK